MGVGSVSSHTEVNFLTQRKQSNRGKPPRASQRGGQYLLTQRRRVFQSQWVLLSCRSLSEFGELSDRRSLSVPSVSLYAARGRYSPFPLFLCVRITLCVQSSLPWGRDRGWAFSAPLRETSYRPHPRPLPLKGGETRTGALPWGWTFHFPHIFPLFPLPPQETFVTLQIRTYKWQNHEKIIFYSIISNFVGCM